MNTDEKVIKVTPKAHKAAKISAAKKGTTVKDYVSDLIEKDSKEKREKDDKEKTD